MKLIMQDAQIVAEASDEYTGPQDWIEAPVDYVPGSFLLLGDSGPVPARCTRRQGQLVLQSHGLLDDAEAAIAAIADPTERRVAQIEYDADTWERSNAFLAQLWAQLGGTPESLDEAFRTAVTL